MKKLLIFLALFVFIVCQTPEERREELRKKRKEHDRKIAECILKSDQASQELKKIIEENKEEDLRKALHPRDHHFERNDRDVIRNCRKEMFDKIREEHKERMRQEHPHPRHSNNENL